MREGPKIFVQYTGAESENNQMKPSNKTTAGSSADSIFSSWKTIQPLSDDERMIDVAMMRPLYESWRASQTRLQASSHGQLAEFNRRLIRRLSIETGILERLYDVDRGTTEALVAHGFAEDLVSHSSTDIAPSRLIDILRDQEAAIQLVMDAVANKRQLTKGLLHELHAIITRHQDTTVAVDQLGGHHDIPLLKGQLKASQITRNVRTDYCTNIVLHYTLTRRSRPYCHGLPIIRTKIRS